MDIKTLILQAPKSRQKGKIFKKLMASLAPARSEVEARVVAKADQQSINQKRQA